MLGFFPLASATAFKGNKLPEEMTIPVDRNFLPSVTVDACREELKLFRYPQGEMGEPFEIANYSEKKRKNLLAESRIVRLLAAFAFRA